MDPKGIIEFYVNVNKDIGMLPSKTETKVDRGRNTRILQNPMNPGPQPSAISRPRSRRSVFCMQLVHKAQRPYTARPSAKVSPLHIAHGNNSES